MHSLLNVKDILELCKLRGGRAWGAFYLPGSVITSPPSLCVSLFKLMIYKGFAGYFYHGLGLCPEYQE